MKNIYWLILLPLWVIILAFPACTLDKEPDIPKGADNGKNPIFFSVNLTAITHDSLRAQARLTTRGNLNILHYGWVWSDNVDPTLQDSRLEMGLLEIDSFATLIPGLSLGKTYHFRPYVISGSGETYGPEKTIFMGLPKLDDIASLADSACFLRVQGSVQSPTPPVEYGIVYLRGTGTPSLQKKDGQTPGTGFSNGHFQTDLSMLQPNTTYVLRAYAITASGTGYSPVKSITTPSSSLLAANFSLDSVDNILFQGADVHFINTSSGATAWFWDFGDGATSTEASPVHTFHTLGDMTVRLQAENGGCRLTKDTLLTFIPNPFADYWVALPGGTFMMGCTPEQGADCDSNALPVHQVTLSPFSIGKTEITEGQWEAVTGRISIHLGGCEEVDCPVESVSWDEISEEFIPALHRKTGRHYRLPTEAEWEYAARGGLDASSMTRYAGSDSADLVGWYYDNAGLDAHPVGQKLPNGYGLSDMTGNVDEWCSDWFGPYMESDVTDPTGPVSGDKRVLRGGNCWTDEFYLLVARRKGSNPGWPPFFAGFRLAASTQ